VGERYRRRGDSFVVYISIASGARRPATGQRLEDGRPEGQNVAQPGFGSRQPCPEGVKVKPNLPEIAIQLRDRMVAKGLTKQALHHH
jgi:hypothetical protein